MIITFLDIFVLTTVFSICLYFVGKRKYRYYDDKGVKCVQPPIPFLGSTVKLLCQMEHFSEFFVRHYNAYPDQKYVGLFEMVRPMLIVRDVDVIKQFAIKDFEHFVNHPNVITDEHDKLFGNVLVSLRGDKWRNMRSTLSPAFTSLKIKKMFQLVEECANQVVEYYTSECVKSVNELIEIDVKDELSKFSIDVIASAAYGIKINSFKDKDNEFYRLGKNAAIFSGKEFFKFFGFAICPKLMKWLDVSLINPEISKFFKEVVLNTMSYRDEHGINRNDMIDILIQAKKGILKHENDAAETSEAGFATVQESSIGKQDVQQKWSDDELVAQAFVFFLAGFDTTSTLLMFFVYEIVRNPDIQKKLQDEIDEFNSNSDGKFVYNDLQKLKYLDMCISETLRLWPPAIGTDRVCTKTYKFPPPTDSSQTKFQVNVGEVVWIPIYAIHRDEKHFPNPDRFDPERFSDENKSSFNPMAFIPFGVGPRNCIGSRFALMESKLIVYHLLSKFDFVTTEKTQIPCVIDKNSFNLNIKGGLKVGLKPRSKN